MVTRVKSAEDGNLNVGTIRAARSVPFSDIDLTFAIKDNGELRKKKEAAAVKQAIRNLLLTNKFEKPFNPDFGGNLIGLLFELAGGSTNINLKKDIIKSINLYEPRANVLDISIQDGSDYNSIYVTVTFRVMNSREVISTTTALSRLR